MGIDIRGFIEIESAAPGGYESLYALQLQMPRHYKLFGALAGVAGDIKPLFPRRGVPSDVSCHGFYRCYRPIIEEADVLGYRDDDFVLPWEVGDAAVLPASDARWGSSKLGYVLSPAMELSSWLLLSEVRQALAHAGIDVTTLPEEYRFLLRTMEEAETIFGRLTRFVFWFSY